MLAGHASGCWLSALGAGMPYNREKNESLVCTPHVFVCIIYILFNSRKFLTLISSKSAIAMWLKLKYYRELVPPSLNRVPLNLWTKLWHFWGRTKGYFEGGGHFLKLNFLGVPANKNLLARSVLANKSLLAGNSSGQ